MFGERNLGGTEEVKIQSEKEPSMEDSSEIKKLYLGSWADKLHTGELLPVGGKSIFKAETNIYLELDFDFFESELKTFDEEHLRQLFEKTGRDNIIKELNKINCDLDPYLFFACLQVQKKADKLLLAEPKESEDRPRMYRNEKPPKLSDMIGITECAERAAFAQYLLQELNINSSYMGGIIMRNPKDDEEFPSKHSFVVINQDGKSSVFDITKPHKSIPRIYNMGSVMNYELFKETTDLLIEGDDSITHSKLYFGIGNVFASRKRTVLNTD